MQMDAQAVAAVNTKTLGGCRRFIAAASDDFICANQSGDIITDKELIEHLKKIGVPRIWWRLRHRGFWAASNCSELTPPR